MKLKGLLSLKLKALTIMSKRVAFADVVVDTTNTQTPPQSTEPKNEPTNEPTEPLVNYEQLISQARKEEKDKLYPEITKLKAEKDSQTKRINELIIEVAEQKELNRLSAVELQKAQSTKVDSEEVKTLKLEVERLTGELAIKDTQLKTIELDSYKSELITGANGEVIVELVTGTSKEELDANFEIAKQSFQNVMSRLQAQTATQQSVQTNAPMPTQNPVVPITNPSVNPVGQQNVDISNLARTSLFDSGSREAYNEVRKTLGL